MSILLYAGNTLGESFAIGAFTGLLISLMYGAYRLFFAASSKTSDNNGKSIPSEEHASNNLYSELIDKCNPQRYMDPYDYDKVNCANEIYQKLVSIENHEDDSVIEFLKKAQEELGFTISTRKILEEVRELCNPVQFVNGGAPQSNKFNAANLLYREVELNKDNYKQLYLLKKKALELNSKYSIGQVVYYERPLVVKEILGNGYMKCYCQETNKIIRLNQDDVYPDRESYKKQKNTEWIGFGIVISIMLLLMGIVIAAIFL